MLKWISFLFFIISTIAFSQHDLKIIELRGIEDFDQNTHLYYRSSEISTQNLYNITNSSIYHYNTLNSSDTLFFEAIHQVDNIHFFHRICTDFTFLNNNPQQYIIGGMASSLDPVVFIQRYDALQSNFNSFGEFCKIIPSNINNNLIYAVITNFYFIHSTDAGITWPDLYSGTDSITYFNALAISPYSDSDFWGIYDDKLVLSSDTGKTFITVDDNPIWNSDSKFLFDNDSIHIYARTMKGENNYFIISDEKGLPYSWNVIAQDTNRFSIALNSAVNGEIYFAAGRFIYKSIDYGVHFNLLYESERRVTGIYKKPGSNILYFSTPYTLKEISPDTISTIKKMPIEPRLKFYPLSIGNKWFYHINGETWEPEPRPYSYNFTKEVISDTLLGNRKNYFIIKELTFNDSSYYSSLHYERIDSSNGKVYYLDDSFSYDNEFIIEDLTAVPGDTIHLDNNNYLTLIVVGNQTQFENWGKDLIMKNYFRYDLVYNKYSLVETIGLFKSYQEFDFGWNDKRLQGALLNGELVGDTILTAISEKQQILPDNFKLFQNYPNPFNPTTKIKFSVGTDFYDMVKIRIYNSIGQLIRVLTIDVNGSGIYEITWDGLLQSGEIAPSDMYIYTIDFGNTILAGKMMLLK